MRLKHLTHRFSQGPLKVPLRWVLVVPFVVQTFVAVGLTGLLSWYNSQKAVHDVVTQLSDSVTARIDQHIEDFLTTPHLFLELNAIAMGQGIIDPNDFQALETNFWHQIQLDDEITYIFYGTEQGYFLGVQQRKRVVDETVVKIKDASNTPQREIYRLDDQRNRVERVKIHPYDPRIRPWYQVAKESGQKTWSPIYSSSDLGVLQITPVVPVYNLEGKLEGVLASNLMLSRLSHFLQTLEISPSAQSFIIERSGELVASSIQEDDIPSQGDGKFRRLLASESQNPLISSTLKSLLNQGHDITKVTQNQQFSYHNEKERGWVQVTPFQDGPSLDWLMVVIIPEEDFMTQIKANNRITIVLCFVTFGITSTIGILTSRWIIQPVTHLSHASSAIARGDLNQSIALGNIKELRILAQSFNSMATQVQESMSILEERVKSRTAALNEEKNKSEKLLLNILPAKIAERLKREETTIAESFDEVTILFADIVGFTPLSTRLKPIELVQLLNYIFSIFDDLADALGLEKIKTIGDAYMVASGLPIPRQDHAEAIADMALGIQGIIEHFQFEQGEKIQIRIGINTGTVVAGVIGIKKFIYDLWGDTVNVASRMESSGEPGKIQVTEATYQQLKNYYFFEERGLVKIKGKGEMKTYWLQGRKEDCSTIEDDSIKA